MNDGLIGSVLAGHRIERCAARGGMGVVYEATELELDRRVALKVISPDAADDEEFRERFMAESKIAASIDHPNIVPIYRAGRHEGLLFLAMRMVDGDDLRTVVRREGALAGWRAAQIVSQVASALDAAHARGLVHRDVKPANVLLAEGDHVYLTDFGLAKALEATEGRTRTGAVVGTLDYLAPEQIRGEQLGPWTDVYALGCLLFYLLTGRVPFPLEASESKMWAHLSEPPPRPSAVRATVDADFDAVVARALAKQPAERYRTAGELGAAALEAATGGETRVPRRPEPVAGRPDAAVRHAAPAARGGSRSASYTRALTVRALRDPFGIALAVAVAGAGAVLGSLTVAVPAALALYVAAAARAYLDQDVQHEVMVRRSHAASRARESAARTWHGDFAPAIAELLEDADRIERGIRAAIERADLPYAEAADEVARFMAEMQRSAVRAQLLHDALEDAPVAEGERRLQQVRARGGAERAALVDALTTHVETQRRMEADLERFHEEMHRVLVELKTIRGRVVSAPPGDVPEHQRRVAGQVSGLRRKVRSVAERLPSGGRR